MQTRLQKAIAETKEQLNNAKTRQQLALVKTSPHFAMLQSTQQLPSSGTVETNSEVKKQRLVPIPLAYQNVKAKRHWQVCFDSGKYEWHSKGLNLDMDNSEPASEGKLLWMDVPEKYQAWFEASVLGECKDADPCSFYLGNVCFDVIDETFGVFHFQRYQPSTFHFRSNT